MLFWTALYYKVFPIFSPPDIYIHEGSKVLQTSPNTMHSCTTPPHTTTSILNILNCFLKMKHCYMFFFGNIRANHFSFLFKLCQLINIFTLSVRTVSLSHTLMLKTQSEPPDLNTTCFCCYNRLK